MLDTNIVVSRYLVAGGPPAQVLRRWRQREFGVLVSDDILGEYERVLLYPHLAALHQLDPAGVAAIIADFRKHETMVTVTQRLSVIADDPDDDKFVECAVASNADVIVSGDKHLLRLGSYRGIRVLSPADFLALLDELS